MKPGFPKTIKTNNPGVLKAARHSVERFNNCTNDIFLFKEYYVSKAMVQVRSYDQQLAPQDSSGKLGHITHYIQHWSRRSCTVAKTSVTRS